MKTWMSRLIRATAKAEGINGNGIICRLYGCLLISGRTT
jgi:hypothetical protein